MRRQNAPPELAPFSKCRTYLGYPNQFCDVGLEIPVSVLLCARDNYIDTWIVNDTDLLQTTPPKVPDSWNASVGFPVKDRPSLFNTTPGSSIGSTGERIVVEARAIRSYPSPVRPSWRVGPLRLAITCISVFIIDLQIIRSWILSLSFNFRDLIRHMGSERQSYRKVYFLEKPCSPNTKIRDTTTFKHLDSRVIAECLGHFAPHLIPNTTQHGS